jgi:hypothetical protein
MIPSLTLSAIRGKMRLLADKKQAEIFSVFFVLQKQTMIFFVFQVGPD